jgi:hypothetical protein
MQTQNAWPSTQQPHLQDANNMLERVMNQLEGWEMELRNTLRWEDDGGRLVTAEKPEVPLNNLRQST